MYSSKRSVSNSVCGNIGSMLKRSAAVLAMLVMTAVTVTAGNVVTLTSETGEVTLQDGDVLTGTGGTETHVTIADGATVTLSDVNINNPGDINHLWPGITGAGNATIILIGTNAVQGGLQSSGIWVPWGYTLTIQGDGSLTATGGIDGAGIGSGYSNDNDCGNIVIVGGTINATGGHSAAGIGSSIHSSCGNITIAGGNITATGGYQAAGIGSGEERSSCGNITIAPDVTVLTVIAGSYADAIGNGYYDNCYAGTITIGSVVTGRIPQTPFNYNPSDTAPYTVTFDANGRQGTMASETFTANTPKALPACTFTCDEYHVFSGWNTAANGKGFNFADEQTIINLGNATLYAQWMPITYSITYTNAQKGVKGMTNTNPKTYTYDSNDITLTDPLLPGYNFDGWTFEGQDIPTKTVIIPRGSSGDKKFTAHWSFSTTATITTTSSEVKLVDGQTLTGTGGNNTHVTIADGATVTLSGVNITEIGNFSSYQWAGITCLGDATIILSGENTVEGGYHSAGIFVPIGRTVTILGNGSLNATGRKYGAGIGGNDETTCGNIIIEGGIITATGGERAAGIGSGYRGSYRNITIAGGNVTATGGKDAAGIGGGTSNSSCGDITIEGGIVEATGGERAAGIGSGYEASCGNITFAGGSVEATGGRSSAGIGCGIGSTSVYSTCGDITIIRGVTKVTATKGTNAQHSIGMSRLYCDCGTVNIGGVFGAITENPYTYTPSGSMTSTVHFDANGGSGEMADWQFTYDGAVHAIPACTFTVPDNMIFVGWNTAADGSGIYYLNGKQIIDIGNVTLYAMWKQPTESVPNGALTLYDGQTLTGTGDKQTHVTIADGATVTLSGVNITSIVNSSTSHWAGITCLGDATIILNGENAVKGGHRSAGIFVPQGKTLTIQGDGLLMAEGNSHSAGIGGGLNELCGDILIEGGTITATDGSHAAGIGGGQYGSCGNIVITGGSITVNLSTGSASAIGCGGCSPSNPSSCGDITITDGITYVFATKISSDKVNIIGTSGTNSTCGTITIDPSLIDILSNEDKTRSIYHGLVLFDDADNATAIAANADGATHDAQLRNRTLYRDGDWNTLCLPFDIDDISGTPLEGATVKTLSNSAFSDGTLTLNFEDATSIEAGKPYIVRWNEGLNLTIKSTYGWNAFAEAVNGGKSFAGKTVLLGADIDVSTMVGTADCPFSGTFEGAGHTLNVSISGDGDGAAPFRYVSGATIRNVKTTGSVSGGNHCAGLVGIALGSTNSIRDCYVSASVSGGSYAGGILGNGTTSTTTISNSLFDGSLTAYNMGILYGWGEDGGTHTVENCLALGTYADVSVIIGGEESGSIDLLLGDGTKTVTNCMKGTEVGSQGDYMVVIYFGEGEHPLVTDYLGSQWTFDNGFVLNPTVNILDTNIENPVFFGVTVNDSPAASVDFTGGQFVGTFSPLTSTAGLLFDAHNPDNGACRAALSIDKPEQSGLTFCGWYTNPEYNNPATTIPFADDGTVTLYAKFTGETTDVLFIPYPAEVEQPDVWYDMLGRQLDNAPTTQGLYIHDGKIISIKKAD